MAENSEQLVTGPATSEIGPSKVVQRGRTELALQNVINGSDSEGRKLYDATRAAVRGEGVGDIPHTTSVYEAAKQSLKIINEPGEINKLESFLNALYKQAGIEEGYKVKVKFEGKLQDLAPDQREELVRNQVTEDFANVDVLIAGHEMERYAKTKAELSLIENEARQELEGGGLSRGEARLLAVRVGSTRRRFLESVDIYSSRIGNTEVGNEVAVSYKEGWQYKESAVEPKKLEPSEEKIEESVRTYSKKLLSENKEREAKLLGMMDNKEEIFIPLLDIDQKIIQQKTKIEEALNAPPDVLAEMVTEYRNLQFERKLRVANVDVAIVQKRIEESDKKWSDVRKTLGEKFKRVYKNPQAFIDAVGNVVNAGEEWVSSRIDTIRPSLENAYNEIKGYVSGDIPVITDDLVYRTLERLDKTIISPVKDEIASTLLYFDAVRDNIKNDELKSRAENKERTINNRRAYYEERYKAEQWLEIQVQNIIITAETAKKVAFEEVGGLIGGEERQKVEERVIRKEEAGGRLLKMKIDRIKSEENPYLDGFKKDQDSRVVWIENLPPEVTETKPQEVTEIKPQEVEKDTFKSIKLTEWEKKKLGVTGRELLADVNKSVNEVAEAKKNSGNAEGNLAIYEKLEKEITVFNEFMSKTLSSKNLDERNPEYVIFLGFGGMIASIVEELKSETDPENRYNLLNAYQNLVMFDRFGSYKNLQ
jgi:hypothetical protein